MARALIEWLGRRFVSGLPRMEFSEAEFEASLAAAACGWGLCEKNEVPNSSQQPTPLRGCGGVGS